MPIQIFHLSIKKLTGEKKIITKLLQDRMLIEKEFFMQELTMECYMRSMP